jgi:hypothetical protein
MGEWIAGAVLIALTCCAAAGTVAARRRALEQEAAAVAARLYPGEVGYQRFAERTSSILRAGVRVGAVLLLLPVLFVILLGPALALAGLPAVTIGLTPGQVICLVGFGLVANILTFDLLSAALIESQALVWLRGTPSRPADFLALTLKRAVLTYVPLSLLVAAAGLPLVLDRPDLLWLVVPAALLWTLPSRLFATRIQTWLHPTEPIESTRWVTLAPRIQSWGERAGLPIAAIRVQHMASVGSSQAHVAGGRRPTLFLSDLMLENTEWRQQDALVGLALGIARQRGRLMLLPTLSLAYLAAIVAVVVLAFGDAGTIPGPSLPTLPVLYDLPLGLLLTVPVVGLAFAVYGIRSSQLARLTLDADRYCAELTGDPAALIVLLHTTIALDAASRQRQRLWRPPIEVRVAALDALMRAPGPHASWASAPVPAIAPVILGPYTLTVPLQPAAPPVR